MRPADPLLLLKQQAAARIVELISGWNAHDIACRMGTDQPRISDLKRGRLERFSLETLIRFLTRLREDVSIETHPRRIERAPPLTPRAPDTRRRPMGA